MKRVAFQGEDGAYSELAARRHFAPAKVKTLAHREFQDVFQAVIRRKADCGVLPIENSLTGSIHQNFDLLLKQRVWITGEIKLRVCHNLLAPRGSRLEDLREVYSHPQALGQCEGYLKKLRKAHPVPYFDTAGSARFVAEEAAATGAGRKDLAAIASAQAAKDYGLKTLARSIEDNEQNFTRFIVVERAGRSGSHPPAPPKGSLHSKTSIVFSFKNIPGALHKCLSIFAIRDIDLVKIESRPIAGSPWKYLFYLDFAGTLAEEASMRALDHLREITTYLKILGSYRGRP